MINFAHGDIGALGACLLAIAVIQWHFPYPVAFPTAIAAAAMRIHRLRTTSTLRGVALCMALVFSGCGTSGLAFQIDDRVEIVSPDERSMVDLPVTIRWRVNEDPFSDEGGMFGVLVDRSAPPPGKKLAWLFRGRDACAGAPGCPTVEYMEERGVHMTRDTSLTIEHVTFATRNQRRKFHEVTVILLDEEGLRMGEAGWFEQFEVRAENR